MRLRVPVTVGASIALAAAAAVGVTVQAQGSPLSAPSAQRISHAAALRTDQTGIHKIKHIIVIMQENRSFDSYFGTYPGADGIPAGVCVPDPVNGGCVAPFADH